MLSSCGLCAEDESPGVSSRYRRPVSEIGGKTGCVTPVLPPVVRDGVITKSTEPGRASRHEVFKIIQILTRNTWTRTDIKTNATTIPNWERPTTPELIPLLIQVKHNLL